MGTKLKHRKLYLNMERNIFSGRMLWHLNTSLREAVQYLSLEISSIELFMVLALVYAALSTGWTG